jgi:shikimate dehydrogenase
MPPRSASRAPGNAGSTWRPSLTRHMVMADVIPNPARTAFLEDAQARGCTTLDGRGMLVNQAVIGIGLWTGVEADATVMRRALESELGS